MGRPKAFVFSSLLLLLHYLLVCVAMAEHGDEPSMVVHENEKEMENNINIHDDGNNNNNKVAAEDEINNFGRRHYCRRRWCCGGWSPFGCYALCCVPGSEVEIPSDNTGEHSDNIITDDDDLSSVYVDECKVGCCGYGYRGYCSRCCNDAKEANKVFVESRRAKTKD